MRSQYPDTITAGGRTRTVSYHMHTHPHAGVTEDEVVHVLENWQLRGVNTDDRGRQSVVYLALVHWRSKMVRVVVSMADNLIVTAFPDTPATTNWNEGNIEYFTNRYQDLEVRDARSL